MIEVRSRDLGAEGQSRTDIWGFSDLRRDHLGYLGKIYSVDQDGVEPSPVLYKSTVLTVELQIHFITRLYQILG